MPMQPKTKLIHVLIANTLMALSMSLVASWVGLSDAGIPQQAFVPAYIRTVGLNVLMSYAISFFVGMFIPAPQWGMALAGALGITPKDGLKFGLVMTVVINTVYCLCNGLILTYVNAIVMGGAPMAAYLPAVLKSLGPCWLAGFVVSFFWVPQSEKMARNITGDHLPPR